MAGISSLKKRMRRAHALGLSLAVVAVCEAFLLADVVADFLRFDISTSWFDHSDIELAAVVSLGVALLVLGKSYWDTTQEIKAYKQVVQTASGNLVNVIQAKFEDWGLSASERDIAFLLIKGLSLQEIASLRNTRPGTIKSQSNSIYRKAGLHGRTELLAYFVEDLLAGETLIPPNRPPVTGT